jgi:hypothetical protein
MIALPTLSTAAQDVDEVQETDVRGVVPSIEAETQVVPP